MLNIFSHTPQNRSWYGGLLYLRILGPGFRGGLSGGGAAELLGESPKH